MKMAMSAESYQRFESQKVVGKNYPWLSTTQIQERTSTFRRTLSAPGENSINANVDPLEEMRKSLNVNINNFDEKKDEKESPAIKKIDFVSNITDDDKINSININKTADEIDTNRPSTSACSKHNIPDDLLDNIDEIKEYLRRTASDEEELDSPTIIMRNDVENFTRVPSIAPPLPPHAPSYFDTTLNRLSTFKDMLIHNAESFIKEKIPRLPEDLFEHHPNDNKSNNKKEFSSPQQQQQQQAFNVDSDDVDNAMLLPTKKKFVNGIESNDLLLLINIEDNVKIIDFQVMT